MKKLGITLILLLVLLLALPRPVLAQTYLFGVSREEINVYWNADGTETIDYVIDFVNDPSADPIDYVDIGLPNANYDLSSITADVNGHPITDIQTSQYVTYGVALGLGRNAIPAGSSGRVTAHIGRVDNTIYKYTKSDRKDYVSVNFMPNYFDSKFITGNTDIKVTLHLPPGINADEPVYFTVKGGWPAGDPQAGYDSAGRVFYIWESQDVNVHAEYTFGAAWPAKYTPPSVIQSVPLMTLPTISFDTICTTGVCGFFIFIFGISIYSSTIGARRRKLAYLPPKISIEGHGIKRGLTAVEAAILMEESMDKILTMTLFGVIKKGAASVVTQNPLKIQSTQPAPQGLYTYETDFINAFTEDGVTRKRALQTMMVDLVKSVSEKMKGFSRKETVDYYRSITLAAWQQVEAAGTPEVKGEKFGEVMEWTMLDKEFDTRTQNTFGTGPVFLPMWWGHYDPVYRSASSGGASTSSAGPSIGGRSISMPSLPGGAFAASVVNSVQNFSAGVVGNLTEFTSGVTNKTNPVPVSRSSGGSFHSGGGCACACACAGCACACAGGGR